MKNKNGQIKIFDTTLRDGQQCPGAAMSFERNLEYAELAAKLNIDVLEAGFPSASKLDYKIVNCIAQRYAELASSPTVAALCQQRREQVERSIESLLPAAKVGRARLHIYLPVDPNLMAASLGERANKHTELIDELAEYVSVAKKAGLEVEFSPEGYSRMGVNFDFVSDLIRSAVSNGANVINCPDTIGGASRFQGAQYFVEHMKQHASMIRHEFPNADVTWSMHCHNDFGLALDNTLQGIFFGPARQVEGCINGIGERAGNVALEQCIMAIKHFAPLVNAEQPLYTQVRHQYLKEVSNFVKKHMLPRQPHSPIVGDNAARHSSGGHTNAILKNPLVYQPFDPAEVGDQITLLFGPLSGGNHAKSIIEERGYICADSEKAKIAQFIKERFQDRRKGITDDELLEAYFEYRCPIVLDSIDYSKTRSSSSVQLSGRFFDREGSFTESHDGKDSALAALKNAIDRYLPGFKVQSHRSKSGGEGIDALSLSQIVIADEAGSAFSGSARDQDIEIAAMKALIDATNQAYIERTYKQ